MDGAESTTGGAEVGSFVRAFGVDPAGRCLIRVGAGGGVGVEGALLGSAERGKGAGGHGTEVWGAGRGSGSVSTWLQGWLGSHEGRKSGRGGGPAPGLQREEAQCRLGRGVLRLLGLCLHVGLSLKCVPRGFGITHCLAGGGAAVSRQLSFQACSD